MHSSKVALFLLLALVGTSIAQVSVTVKTTAKTESSAQALKASGTANTFESKLLVQTPSVKVTTENDATITVSLNAVADLTTIIGGLLGSTGVSFAGGLSADSVNLFVGFDTSVLATTLAGLKTSISLTITSDVDTTVTIKLNTGSFGTSADANAKVQTGLFLASNDASLSGSGTVYGAVAYTVSDDNKEYAYTFPVKKGETKLYLKPFDLNKAKNANGNAGANNNGGSASLNFAGTFLPVAYNTKFNLQSGYQYAFGNNLRVTPAGSSSGDLLINYDGTFSASSTKSAGPAGASAYLDGSYYFSSQSSAQNVIQYVAKKSDQTKFYANGTLSASVDAIGTAKGKALTWYRAAGDAGATVAANAWSKVSSTSNYDANGNLVVYAQVSSYSHWTVGANDGAAAGLQITIATVLMAALFAIAF